MSLPVPWSRGPGTAAPLLCALKTFAGMVLGQSPTPPRPAAGREQPGAPSLHQHPWDEAGREADGCLVLKAYLVPSPAAGAAPGAGGRGQQGAAAAPAAPWAFRGGRGRAGTLVSSMGCPRFLLAAGGAELEELGRRGGVGAPRACPRLRSGAVRPAPWARIAGGCMRKNNKGKALPRFAGVVAQFAGSALHLGPGWLWAEGRWWGGKKTIPSCPQASLGRRASQLGALGRGGLSRAGLGAASTLPQPPPVHTQPRATGCGRRTSRAGTPQAGFSVPEARYYRRELLKRRKPKSSSSAAVSRSRAACPLCTAAVLTSLPGLGTSGRSCPKPPASPIPQLPPLPRVPSTQGRLRGRSCCSCLPAAFG